MHSTSIADIDAALYTFDVNPPHKYGGYDHTTRLLHYTFDVNVNTPPSMVDMITRLRYCTGVLMLSLLHSRLLMLM